MLNQKPTDPNELLRDPLVEELQALNSLFYKINELNGIELSELEVSAFLARGKISKMEAEIIRRYMSTNLVLAYPELVEYWRESQDDVQISSTTLLGFRFEAVDIVDVPLTSGNRTGWATFTRSDLVEVTIMGGLPTMVNLEHLAQQIIDYVDVKTQF